MAIAYGNIGAVASGSAPTVPLPTGWAQGDYAIIVSMTNVSTDNNSDANVPATPSGWTKLGTVAGGDGAQGGGAGTRRLTFFGKVLGSSESGVVVTTTGANFAHHYMVTFTKGAGETWDTPGVELKAKNTDSTSWSETLAANPGLTAGNFALTAYALQDDATGASAWGLSATGATIGTVTNRANLSSITGNDGTLCINTAPITAGTASAAPTLTMTTTTTESGAVGLVVLKLVSSLEPVPPPADTVGLTDTVTPVKTAMLQVAPTSDGVVVGSWVNESAGTTNLYLSIDEAAPGSTADYVESPNNVASTDFYRARFAMDGPPLVAEQHRFEFRHGKSATGGRSYDLSVTLRDGSDNIVATRSWTSGDLETTDRTDLIELTAGEIAAIQNYSELRAEFNPTSVSGGSPRAWRLYWAEFRVPAANPFDRLESEDVGITDSLSFVLTSAVEDTVGLTDTATPERGVSRSLADNLGLTDAVGVERLQARSVTDTANVTDTVALALAYNRAVTDNQGLTDTSVRESAHVRALTDNQGLTDTTATAATFNRTLTDTQGLTDIVAGLVVRELADTAALTDAITTTLTVERTISDNLDLTDTASPFSEVGSGTWVFDYAGRIG